MDPHHFASSVLLAIIALLSPLFSYQLFPEWQSWRLPSHRSQIPLVAEHRSNEEAPTHIDNNNFPRKISRLSRDSSDSEGYFQYLNIPSQKVDFLSIPQIDYMHFKYLFSRNTSLDGTEETRYTLLQDLNKERITDSEQG